MNNKPWLIPVMIAAYIVIRVVLAIRRRSGPQKPIDPMADRRRIMIKFVWLILLIVVLGLLYFAPNRGAQTANPSQVPAPPAAAQPAAKP
jgi:hypothetical protein